MSTYGSDWFYRALSQNPKKGREDKPRQRLTLEWRREKTSQNATALQLVRAKKSATRELLIRRTWNGKNAKARTSCISDEKLKEKKSATRASFQLVQARLLSGLIWAYELYWLVPSFVIFRGYKYPQISYLITSLFIYFLDLVFIYCSLILMLVLVL